MSTTRSSVLVLLLTLSSGTIITSTTADVALLENVTHSVFGDELNILPLAFGDFNSDKLTDIVVLDDSDRSKITILLAQPQTFSLETSKYFILPSEARKSELVCYFNQKDIVSAAPGDFDGDGGMDIMVVTRDLNNPERLQAVVLWGEHDHKTKKHTLLCSKSGLNNAWDHFVDMTSEPLVIDGDGNNIADLYGSSANNNSRGIWFYGTDRLKAPYFVILDHDVKSPLRSPLHSNAFIDLDNNGNADLFLTTNEGFEIWQNVGGESSSHFEKHKSIDYPVECSSGIHCIGQSVFADFDLDGKIDMIFPICQEADCASGSFYFSTVESLWNGVPEGFRVIPFNSLGKWKFDSLDNRDERNIYPGLTPHVGDINLDGYPDLMIRLKNLETKETQMHVLLNVYDKDSPTTYQRGFLLQEEIMRGINGTVMSTFYDIYENGMEDILLVRHSVDKKKFELGAYTNVTQDSDAYFVKVIVLSGICYKDCTDDHVEVPYGTNLPGQRICYKTQRPGAQETTLEIESCASQLTQTAHHALQLPYTIFGLGMAPNFLDFMSVNVTNASAHSLGKSWPQIIPNSQMYVIPHPPQRPSMWEAKLFITPSRGITLTGLALVGTCGLCLIIILFFHWRERRQDKREKMQQPNQFHFDAM